MSGVQKFDTIIIGAGVAGSAAAALLAKDHGKKVLLIERAPFLGGRCLSYVGKGNKVIADGVEMDAKEFKKSLAFSHCYLGKCTPDIETIFNKGLLDGWTFEAGGHGLFWGNSGRVDTLMTHLGVYHEQPLNEGLGFIEWRGEGENGEGKPGVVYQVGKGEPYGWMTEDGYRNTMNALRDMAMISSEEQASLMQTSLQEWLDSKDLHPEAYDYIKVLAASQTAQAEPLMTPAGDFLGYMSLAGKIGMNLVTGSVATAAEPGCIAMPVKMAEAAEQHGCEIMKSTAVKEVIIEDGRVRGVKIKALDNDYDETRVIEADNVICTIPPKYIFSVLPEEVFPQEYVRTLKEQFWGAGLLTGWAVTKRPMWEQIGLDNRSFIYMPGVIRDEGYIGAVDMVMCEFTAWNNGDAKRGPAGGHDFVFSTALTDEEMRNPQKVNRVIELCENWARATWPSWDDDLEFLIWTPSPEAYGLWRPIGEKRPDVKSAHIEGLYFAGDQYGERMWGGGVDGASLSAVMCVDSMMGTDQESEIFPELHRGLPKEKVA